ncbi:MAG: response regulator [Oscillospiraceae bacterium]|nr:response regulator [Oscillospiraceae bacterium]
MEKNTILIVDDFEFNRELLRELFPDREILEAANGSSAIEQYEQHKDEICAVLTDIMMPQSDGFTLLEYFSKNRYMDDVPVFVISADTSTAANIKAFRLGAEAMITKPFNTNFLQKHIEHIMELYELRRKSNL